MIESIFQIFSPEPEDDNGDSQGTVAAAVQGKEASDLTKADASLTAALSTVEKIVGRKFLFARQTGNAPGDIVNLIALRLLKWRDKYRRKATAMSPEEWQSFAARTAYNEINRLSSKQSSTRNVGLEEVPEISSPVKVEGSSNAEARSLLRFLWQEICQLSLKQRRSLLLHSYQLSSYLWQSGISNEEISQSLEIELSEWTQIKARIPLSNEQIALLLIEKSGGKTGNRKDLEAMIKSVKNSRYEARRKINNLIKK